MRVSSGLEKEGGGWNKCFDGGAKGQSPLPDRLWQLPPSIPLNMPVYEVSTLSTASNSRDEVFRSCKDPSWHPHRVCPTPLLNSAHRLSPRSTTFLYSFLTGPTVIIMPIISCNLVLFCRHTFPAVNRLPCAMMSSVKSFTCAVLSLPEPKLPTGSSHLKPP